MDTQEIIDAYNVLAQNVEDKTAAEAAKIGNSQRSLGLMAERVASPSGQTSGLANYTYNRTLRPTLETTTTSLITQGKAAALQKELADKLRAAKNNYQAAQNALTSGGGDSGGDGGNYNESGDLTLSDDIDQPTSLKDLQLGTILGTAVTDGRRWVTVSDGKGGQKNIAVGPEGTQVVGRAVTRGGVYITVRTSDGKTKQVFVGMI